MAFKNDMTWMYAMHAALRRELERIARVTARPDDDPRNVLRTAAGWEMFKSYLHVHHSTEDDMLWPQLRETLAGAGADSDGLALLDAMEAEHAAIDPLLAAIDAALLDPAAGPQQLGELADSLAAGLRGHLDHEEAHALALIDSTITEQQWVAFGVEHGQRIGGDIARYLPWILDDASPDDTAKVLGLLPPPVQQLYREAWQPAYAQLPLWDGVGPGTTSKVSTADD